MTESYPLTQAQARLGELVNRAHYEHERVVLTEHGAPVAAIISMDELDELDELQRAQDAADIALCEEVKARSGPGLPHDEFMAMLDAEDAGNASKA